MEVEVARELQFQAAMEAQEDFPQAAVVVVEQLKQAQPLVRVESVAREWQS